MFRCVPAPAVAALMVSAWAPAAWAQAVAPPPGLRMAPAIASYWRGHGPDVVTGDPSADAPGTFSPTIATTHVASSAGASAAEVALLKRRLQVVLTALLEQPSLRDPRGVSVLAGINVTRIQTDSGPGALTANIGLAARGIRLDDPKTIRAKDGRFYTPGEAVILRIVLNPTDFLQEKLPTLQPGAGALTAVEAGSSSAFLVTARPLAPSTKAEDLVARWATDRGWTGPTGEAPMLVYLSSYRQENGRLETGQLPPTAALSRLAAAVAMVDWADVRARMLAVH